MKVLLNHRLHLHWLLLEKALAKGTLTAATLVREV